VDRQWGSPPRGTAQQKRGATPRLFWQPAQTLDRSTARSQPSCPTITTRLHRSALHPTHPAERTAFPVFLLSSPALRALFFSFSFKCWHPSTSHRDSSIRLRQIAHTVTPCLFHAHSSLIQSFSGVPDHTRASKCWHPSTRTSTDFRHDYVVSRT
jgi:hypothetical protein